MIAPTIDELNSGVSANFRFERLIDDSGGQGAVFKGTFNGGAAALKIINPLTTENKRVERELNFLKANQHPQVVKVLSNDSIIIRGSTFHLVAYEFLEGGDLSKFLGQTPLPDQSQVAKLGRQICEAVEFIWSAKDRVVHRDIKPKNIMKRNTDDYVLVDFGFARHIDLSDVTIVGSCGTRGYASPEQALGRKALTYKSDIFSLGVTLFLFATGKHPFNGQQPLPGTTISADIFSLRPDLVAEMQNLILSMLRINPSERPVSASTQFKNLES